MENLLLPLSFCCECCGKPFREVAETRDGKVLVEKHEVKCKQERKVIR